MWWRGLVAAAAAAAGVDRRGAPVHAEKVRPWQVGGEDGKCTFPCRLIKRTKWIMGSVHRRAADARTRPEQGEQAEVEL